jgi:thioredoxin-related protein
MNKLILTIVFAVSVSVVFAQKKKKPAQVQDPNAPTQVIKSLRIGSGIPNEGIMLMSVNGRPTSLLQAKTDKGLLVMFSCNTCPYVIKGQGRTRDAIAQAKYMGVGMVIINSNEGQRGTDDAPMVMTEYAKEQNYTVPYLVDEQSRMADAFGATRTPEVFLFNGKGKLVYKGAVVDNPAEPEQSTRSYVVDAMQAMTEGKPVKPAETKSIGCSIKRATL